MRRSPGRIRAFDFSRDEEGGCQEDNYQESHEMMGAIFKEMPLIEKDECRTRQIPQDA